MHKRYMQALALAAEAHAAQMRKGTENAAGFALPYITHPVAVSALIQRYGGTEDQCIAGLLHDVLEDGGPHYAPIIRERFGDAVLALVEFCTDGTPDSSGEKAPWEDRKRAYLAHLAAAEGPGVLVSACDKLHNLTSINADRAEVGDAVFDRFGAGQTRTLWYYGALVETLAPKVPAPLAAALRRGIA